MVRNRIIVSGGSMVPFILPTSLLGVEPFSPSSVRRGDVICFLDGEKDGVAHRITKDFHDGDTILQVRGDAQSYAEEVPISAVTFVVRRVEHKYFSYDTDGAIGRIFAWAALESDVKAKVAKLAFRKVFEGARYVNGMVKNLVD